MWLVFLGFSGRPHFTYLSSAQIETRRLPLAFPGLKRAAKRSPIAEPHPSLIPDRDRCMGEGADWN